MIIGIHFLAALILLAYLATRILGIRGDDWNEADYKNKITMVLIVLFLTIILPFYTGYYIGRKIIFRKP